jgi:transposase-like protein
MEPWESEFKDFPMNCPHCGAELIIGSPMDHIIAARRTCPVCKQDFMIENDKPVGKKKPSHRAR